MQCQIAKLVILSGIEDTSEPEAKGRARGKKNERRSFPSLRLEKEKKLRRCPRHHLFLCFFFHRPAFGSPLGPPLASSATQRNATKGEEGKVASLRRHAAVEPWGVASASSPWRPTRRVERASQLPTPRRTLLSRLRVANPQTLRALNRDCRTTPSADVAPHLRA